jgi:hypothetical protein
MWTDRRRHRGFCHNWQSWVEIVLPPVYRYAGDLVRGERSVWIRECRYCPKLEIRGTEPRQVHGQPGGAQ